MARYIDANKLEEEVVQSKNNNPHSNRIQAQMHTHEHRHFLCMINKQPTADVVEVKHGYWEDERLIKTGGLTTCHPSVRCTKCKMVFCDLINNASYMFNYCPHCGAKMDKNDGVE